MKNRITAYLKNFKKFKNKSKSLKIFNFFSSQPLKLDVYDSSRNHARLNEILVKLLSFLSLICLFFAFLIVTLIPLKEKEPYFVTFLDKSEQIVYVEPYKTTVNQQRQQKEFLARYYVTLRETIDLLTDLDRVKNAIFYATQKEADEYLETLDTRNPDSPYRIAVEKNMTSSVEIVSSSVLNNDQYQVEFILTNKIYDNVVSTQLYIATISFVSIEPSYRGETHLINPLWYRVSEYSKRSKAEYAPKKNRGHNDKH